MPQKLCQKTLSQWHAGCGTKQLTTRLETTGANFNTCLCWYWTAPWLWRYTYLLVLIFMLWHKETQINPQRKRWYEITLRWMPLDLTYDESTLVQVMAWCRQATSHYLSQCWPKSMPPNGITRPQWVKPLRWRSSWNSFSWKASPVYPLKSILWLLMTWWRTEL